MKTQDRRFAPYTPTLEHAAATLPVGALEKLRAEGRELLRLLVACGAQPTRAPLPNSTTEQALS